MASGPQFTIIFQNNSSMMGDLCVFQQDPRAFNVMSLAWFTKPAAPTTRVQFSWQIEYDFSWAQTGRLAPGVLYSASQIWPAGLTSNNQVTFTKEAGMYTFKDQRTGPAGSLLITEDSTIPSNMTSVGIGMAGAATFAVQAQPNMNVQFTPQPQYWVAFGNYMTGQVLDVNMMSNPVQVNFPPNIYTMVVTLNPDNTWTVQPLDTYNAELLEAQEATA